MQEGGDTPFPDPLASFPWLPLGIFVVAALAALVLFVYWRDRRTWPWAVGTAGAVIVAVVAVVEFVGEFLSPLAGLGGGVGFAIVIVLLLLLAAGDRRSY